MLRKKIIAGNWKMNKTKSEAKELILSLKDLTKNANCEIVICVPYTNLDIALELTKGSNIKVGAQNCHWEKSGAFTGEISVGMLKELGVEYVIVGHSERRNYFGENNIIVNKKLLAALESSLKVILCVGEDFDEYTRGVSKNIVELQTRMGLTGVLEKNINNVVIAYEPIWAIGTGKTATSEQANEVIKMIRDLIAKLYSNQTANSIQIQYGGSMNIKNAKDLLNQSDIDGGLIGGASLIAEDFVDIIKAGN